MLKHASKTEKCNITGRPCKKQTHYYLFRGRKDHRAQTSAAAV